MSLHDKLTQTAIEIGKHSSDFSAAAEKHANATWFYLIISGVVLYFFGWQYALISAILFIYTAFQSISATKIATRLENHERNLSLTNIEEIIQAYGKILETAIPGTITDVKELPYSKQEIKNALIVAISITDDLTVKEFLKVGYIDLCNWQEGVDEISQGFIVNSSMNPEDVLKQAPGLQWLKIAEKEQKTLMKELRSMKLK